jgi:hypothetical protein
MARSFCTNGCLDTASSNNGRSDTVSGGKFGGKAGKVPQSRDGSDP